MKSVWGHSGILIFLKLFRDRFHCYGEAEFWESAYLAYHFYMTGARCCDGSEANRYLLIAVDIEDGKKVASDGEPVRKMIMRVA